MAERIETLLYPQYDRTGLELRYQAMISALYQAAREKLGPSAPVSECNEQMRRWLDLGKDDAAGSAAVLHTDNLKRSTDA